jgi:hypothetical protein
MLTRLAALALASFCALSGVPCAAQEVATSDPALICGYVQGMSYSRDAVVLQDYFAQWTY